MCRLTIIVCGMFVLTYSTAPSFNSIFTSAEFVFDGSSFRRATYPTVDCVPSTQKLSFRLIGRPWRGPIGLPSRGRYSSKYLARSSASGKNDSVRQDSYRYKIKPQQRSNASSLRNTHNLLRNSSPLTKRRSNIQRTHTPRSQLNQ